MRYSVSGIDRDSGLPIELIVEAADVHTAAMLAVRKGIHVSAVQQCNPSFPRDRPSPQTVPSRVKRPEAKRAPAGCMRSAWRAVLLILLVIAGVTIIVAAIVGRQLSNDYRAKREAADKAREQLEAAAWPKYIALVEQAETALSESDLLKAQMRVDESLRVPDVPNRARAISLRNKLRDSANADWVFEVLVSAPDEEFERFRGGGDPPAGLDFGFPVLNERALGLARTRVEDAGAARERQKAAAEAQPKQTHTAASGRAQTVDSANSTGGTLLLEKYLKVLEGAEPRLVDSVRVRRVGAGSIEAEIQVKDIWHLRHYQLRKQDAQTMWEWWAEIASPRDPDSARIKIIDGKGNEVGGSRIWGGSLIWVQE